MRRRTLLLGLALLATPAAADEPFNWTGFYIGAHGGWATGDMALDLNTYSMHAHTYNQFFDSPTGMGASGALWGLQAGANVQRGQWVAGVEADIAWSDIEAKETFNTAPTYAPAYNPCANPGPIGCTDWTTGIRLKSLGTARLRLGYLAAPSLLLYGTGGLAWGEVDVTYDADDTTPPSGAGMFRLSGSGSHIGWTAGGGVEWALGSNLSLRAEYLYIDLGEAQYAVSGYNRPECPTPTSCQFWNDKIAADLTFHTVRAGLNYKFGGN